MDEQQKEKPKIQLKKISDNEWEIPKQGKMNVPVRIFASEKLLKLIENDKSLEQGMHVACLPNIQKYSYMMPDAHQGYGMSVGGVAAFPVEDGIISPGMTGFDINCGVRLLATPLNKEQVEPKIKELLDALFKNVPSGVGRDSQIHLKREELDRVLKEGAKWTVENDYAFPEDLEVTESNGCLELADPNTVSNNAKERGKNQLGTLGAGNHFLEVQFVDHIHNKEAAKKMGITEKGQICVMIHCGSRGLGHQVCSDYLRKFEDAFPEIANSLPDRDLIYAPADTPLAKQYFGAMCAAANFAWANRQIIVHGVRKAFKSVFDVPPRSITQVYDVAHNIIKREKYDIDGKEKELYIHRKGATRAFGPNNAEICAKYRDIGQPILIPGSMGTASFVLIGTETSAEKSFASTAHGAGRVMSRHEANRRYTGEGTKKELEAQHIFVKAASWKGISEEAPGAYKDVDEVVQVSHDAGIGNIVVRLKPLGVVKG
ncbi:RtcB family protein [Candidatus Woesearchaeota archaeon]|nr:RtcB family protein [Candidatus Woesearchaeota archaeon]